MRALVLDSEAISQLARSSNGVKPGRVHTAVRAAANADRPIVVPAAVLAEQYRGGRHDALIDSCLRRYDGVRVVDTTRPLARTVGNLLARAGMACEHHVDATVVATAIAYGGGVILTSDVDDLKKIAAGHVNVVVEPV